MSGIPVVIVPSGGIPVTPVQSGAPLMTSVAKFGTPITLTANAAPFIISGITPDPPTPMGPLDYVATELNAFTNFSRPYGLAAPSAVVGFSCYYEGDPVISMAHGGEPLTIIRQERIAGILTLIAAGTGLTVEVANLTINATGGNLHGGALRINEMINVQPALSGWNDGVAVSASRANTPPVTGSQGGVSKIAVASSYNSSNLRVSIIGATSVWGGYLVSGPPVPADISPAGDWVLGDGWSWVGDKLVHTGPESTARIDFDPINWGKTSAGGATSAIIAAGGLCNVSIYSHGVSRAGYYSGPLFYPISGVISFLSFTARGDVELSGLLATSGAQSLSWSFGTAPTVDGDTYGITTIAPRPDIAISAAEILGEDY